MAGRIPKMNWTPSYGQFTCTIDGEFHRLGKDEEQAEAQFKFLLRQAEKGVEADPNASFMEVAEAYLVGLEKYVAKGRDPSRVASVASFFVSRIDSAVDKLLDEKIAQANDPDEKARLGKLKGTVAIANAKLAYQRYKRLFAGERWKKLAANGAKQQRLLWASTGTKNKAYSDVLYVEELIGPNTINTMPPATLDAFREHGRARDSLEENIQDAQRVLGDLSRAGIDKIKPQIDKAKQDGAALNSRLNDLTGKMDRFSAELNASRTALEKS